MSAVKIHTTKDAHWTDASGAKVPLKFVPSSAKSAESLAGKIFKNAITVEQQLSDLHKQMKEAVEEVANAIKIEYSLKNKGKEKKPGKGAITWYNFDRSLKIEASVNEIPKWDGSLLSAAHGLLKEYISGAIGEANELIKGLVNDAFANNKGGVDSKKILQILRYEDKIKNAKFQKACELLKQAQSIDKTKLYMRVWAKEDNGEYRDINLNFSSI